VILFIYQRFSLFNPFLGYGLQVSILFIFLFCCFLKWVGYGVTLPYMFYVIVPISFVKWILIVLIIFLYPIRFHYQYQKISFKLVINDGSRSLIIF
jgi:hypothetical protein